MRILSLHIWDPENFKGVDAVLPWAGTVVLFGANDSGKTNILESVAAYFSLDRIAIRWDPLDPMGQIEPFVKIEVRFDARDLPGSRDQRITYRLLSSGLGAYSDLADQGLVRIAELNARETPLADIPAEELHDAVIEHVERLRAYLGETMSEVRGMFPDRASDYEIVADAVVASANWLLDEDMFTWIAPSAVALSSDARRAYERLRNADWPDGEPWLLQRVSAPQPDSRELNPYSVDRAIPRSLLRPISLDVSGQAPLAFYEAIDAYIHEQLDERESVEDPYWGGEIVSVAEYKRRRSDDPRGRRDSWLDDEGSLVPLVEEICVELGERADEIAPPFVSERYAIEVEPHGPRYWRALGSRRTTVRLHRRDGSGSYDLDVGALGIATWVRLALLEAKRELRDEMRGVAEDVPILYLFDEPEAHLHPLAQEQAAAWITRRSVGNVHFLLATHSLDFLRFPPGDIEYLQIRRNEAQQTIATRMTDDVVGTLRETAAEAGIPPAAVVQLARGWLVVEGEMDKLVIEHFFGRDLRRAGVWILPLRGMTRTEASFLNLAVLKDFHLPFFVLLDNARAGQIERGELPAAEQTDEEKVLAQLIRLSIDADVHPLGLPYPDIIRALPFQALAAAAERVTERHVRASSWDEIDDAFATLPAQSGKKTPKYKTYVCDALGWRGRDPDDLIRTATALSPAADFEPALYARVQKVLAVSAAATSHDDSAV